jgi:hypothetical protein
MSTSSATVSNGRARSRRPVRFHLRRLEALRRAGHTERIDKRVPNHIVERSMAHDLSQGGDSLRVLTLSTFDLEPQIGSDGAT